MNKKLVHSHTSLDTFQNCPRKWEAKFLLKSIPFVQTDAMRWGTQVHKAMEERVRDGTPLPEGMEAYEQFATAIVRHPEVKTEHKMGMGKGGGWTGFFASDTWFRGTADVVIFSTKPGGGGETALLLDYKTGKKREDPTELERHAMLLAAEMPGLKSIKGAYVWLQEKALGQMHELDTDRTLRSTKQIVQQLDEQIAKDKFPPNQNPLCGWCDVTSCEFNPKGQR